MAKRLVAVMIVLIISFSSCGCVYKNKTVELDEVVEYEKACFEKAKEVVEAAGFNLSREKEKLNVETEHIMTSAYINMEDGSILINCVFYSTIQSYPTVYMKYEKKEEAKPYIKCSGMNIELFSQIIEIYTGIEITICTYIARICREISLQCLTGRRAQRRQATPMMRGAGLYPQPARWQK